jgi:probable rRNA maturation factor
MLKPVIIKRSVKRSIERIPKKFLEKWVASCGSILLQQKISAPARRLLGETGEVSLVFVSRTEIRRLNREFRSKDNVTDVLSFAPTDEGSLGELVLCLAVITRQAADHGLSLNEELGYMVLHGILHLLGYDHERSKRGSEQMLGLQDRVFEILLDA